MASDRGRLSTRIGAAISVARTIVRAGFDKETLARFVLSERLDQGIRAICPPHLLEAAFVEARARGWTSETLYHQLASGWLPPAVD